MAGTEMRFRLLVLRKFFQNTRFAVSYVRGTVGETPEQKQQLMRLLGEIEATLYRCDQLCARFDYWKKA